jgi:hypothetical protein
MAYSTIVKPGDYFNTKMYDGNGGTNALTGVGFQPDWVWIKNRDATDWHFLTDAVRGVTKTLHSNTTNAESTQATALTAFGSDGFTVGSDGSVNRNNQSFVAWNWKGNGAGSTNNDGNRTSTVSASTTSGFSIVRYQGNSSNNQTIGHGLGVAPKMIFIKNLSSSLDWIVYNKTITAAKHLHLNTTAEAVSDNGMFNGVEPTATVFNVHANNDVNKANDYFIAYCFAEKKGYSKFGSYTGDGNTNGPFVYTGFKPAFFITKRTDAGAGWQMYDSTRDVDNPADHRLQAQSDAVELVGDANTDIDFLSNGFNLRNADADSNASGGNYIYMAFAEEPLVANSGTDGVPATAR